MMLPLVVCSSAAFTVPHHAAPQYFSIYDLSFTMYKLKSCLVSVLKETTPAVGKSTEASYQSM